MNALRLAQGERKAFPPFVVSLSNHRPFTLLINGIGIMAINVMFSGNQTGYEQFLFGYRHAVHLVGSNSSNTHRTIRHSNLHVQGANFDRRCGHMQVTLVSQETSSLGHLTHLDVKKES